MTVLESTCSCDTRAAGLDSPSSVVRLREWGSDTVYGLSLAALAAADQRGILPREDGGHWRRLVWPHVDAIEAAYDNGCWRISDRSGQSVVRQDGVPQREIVLTAGMEITLGDVTLIAESPQWIALRAYCARLLGFSVADYHAIDLALRSIRLAISHRSPLFLFGDGDMVPLAESIHGRTLGNQAPFLMSDRRRNTGDASVRSPRNHGLGVDAFIAASGGSLCMRAHRLPPDYEEVIARFCAPDNSTCLILCAYRGEHKARLMGPAPIMVPPLRARRKELPRIVMEYAAEAIADLAAPKDAFTATDLGWVLASRPATIPEIQKTVLRVVARNQATTMVRAATRLGMASVSLARWFERKTETVLRVNGTDSGSATANAESL